MLIATITVDTCTGEVDFPVEVLGKGPRPGTAWVKALGGCRPFTKMSHGGPYQDDKAVVFLPCLCELRIAEVSLRIPVSAPFERKQEDWFLEIEYEDRTYIDESG